MRSLLAACLLVFSAPALADEPAKTDRAAELRAKIARLEGERDAARVRANTYVLPKDKLEVLAKQQEIDEARRELESLGKKTP